MLPSKKKKKKIGQVSEVLKTQGAQLIVPVALLHAAAFSLGYWFSKISSFGESTSRTISIECGMQVLLCLFCSTILKYIKSFQMRMSNLIDQCRYISSRTTTNSLNQFHECIVYDIVCRISFAFNNPQLSSRLISLV